MKNAYRSQYLLGGLVSLMAMAAVAGSASAQSYPAPDKAYDGVVRFSSSVQGAPIFANSEVVASGQGFDPGQTVTVYHGATALTQTLTADAEGKVETRFRLPADAAVGVHPLVVVSNSPYGASVSDLKISPDLPVTGNENYRVLRAEAVRGLYQSAYSARNNALFVTSAVGRPPVLQSELLRLNADTLAIEARATPQAAPARTGRDGVPVDGGLFAVYGVGVDDTNGNIWVTQSRQNTVAVYRQSDLSLVRQFEPGTAPHARDAVIDGSQDKAYVSATFEPEVIVFKASQPEVLKRIAITSGKRGERFSAASLSMDDAAHRLYVVSNSTSEVAVIDTRTDEVRNVFAVPGARGTIGVSHDPQTGRIFVAAQGSDNVVILDGQTGAVLADTPVGAGALNVVFDPALRQAFVANRGSKSIAVLDEHGAVVANFRDAPQVNHVAGNGQGVIYGVTKGSQQDGANMIWRIQSNR